MPVPFNSKRFSIQQSQNPNCVYKIPKREKYSASLQKEYEIYNLLESSGITYEDVQIGKCTINTNGVPIKVNYLEMPKYQIDLYEYLDVIELTKKEFLSTVYQITKAVLGLHKFGIVHRDIKLENFCCDLNTGNIYMIDFELAHKAHELTNIGGTIDYMLPSRKHKKIDYVEYYIDIVGLLITISQILYVAPYLGKDDTCVVPYYVDAIMKKYKRNYDSVDAKFFHFIGLFDLIDKLDWEELNSKGRIKFIQALRGIASSRYGS